MATAPINAIYLSGWEYNRMLQSEPWTPRNSALPGEILWNGSAQFWLFEKVYCTKEALDNERDAGEKLGWTTARIFAEMADDDERWFEPVDWQRLPDTTKSELLQKHKKLVQDLEKDNVDIREAIKTNDAVLEVVKAELLRPILVEKKCVLGISPSSLKTWKLPQSSSLSVQKRQLLHKLVAMLQKPLELEYTARDKRLCYPPLPDELARTIEAPLIQDLVAGDGRFSGPTGYVPYHDELYEHKELKERYQKADEALGEQWKANKDVLKELRYTASQYLWKDLHGEWLPELFARGDVFLDEFQKRLNRALKMSKFAKFLDTDSKFAAGIAGSAAGLITCLAARIADIEVDLKEFVAAGGLTGTLTGYAQDRYGGPLAAFYQKARNIGAREFTA